MTTTGKTGTPTTESRLRDLYALGEFLTTHAAVLPGDLGGISAHFHVDSRERLNALAEHFGKPVPGDAGHYRGAQFSVHVPGMAGYSSVVFSWEAP